MADTTTHVALVTGANRGIGRAVVSGLGAAGWTVFLAARDGDAAGREAAISSATGSDVRGLRLDVTDPHSIARAAREVEDAAGHLDALVNNAGIGGNPGSETPGDVDLDSVRRVFETNVFGVMAVTEAMLPLLRRSPSGRIVNVSSSIGSLTLMSDPDHYFAGMPGWLGYPVSKAALNQITLQYAKQLRSHGISVNAADPGPTDTGLVASSPTATGARAAAGRSPEEGARVIVDLVLTAGEETGGYRRESGPVPW